MKNQKVVYHINIACFIDTNRHTHTNTHKINTKWNESDYLWGADYELGDFFSNVNGGIIWFLLTTHMFNW